MGSRSSLHKELGTGGKILVVLHGLLSLALGLSNLFVNLYLWRLRGDVQTLAFFNLFLFIAVPLVFIFGGWLAKRKDRLLSLRLGVFFHAFFYLIVLLLTERTPAYVIPLGLLKGFGVGFYHFAEHILVYDFTEDKNRDYLVGWNNLATSTSEMIAPFFGGLIISRFIDFTGYLVIFGISFVLFTIAFIGSFFLHRRTESQDYRLKEVFKKRNEDWDRVLVSAALNGFRTGSFFFLLPLLIFLIAESEFLVGSFTMGMGVLTLITSYILGRFIRPEERKDFTTVALVFLTAGLIALVWDLEFWGLILFGAVTAIFETSLDILFEGISFKIIEDDPEGDELRIEYLVNRELPLNIGRTSAIGLFILISGAAADPRLLRIFFLFLIPSGPFAAYMIQKIKR